MWYTLCSYVCALFTNDWYELVCELGMFAGACVRKQCKSLDEINRDSNIVSARASRSGGGFWPWATGHLA